MKLPIWCIPTFAAGALMLGFALSAEAQDSNTAVQQQGAPEQLEQNQQALPPPTQMPGTQTPTETPPVVNPTTPPPQTTIPPPTTDYGTGGSGTAGRDGGTGSFEDFGTGGTGTAGRDGGSGFEIQPNTDDTNFDSMMPTTP